jgi:hypothetical protein
MTKFVKAYTKFYKDSRGYSPILEDDDRVVVDFDEVIEWVRSLTFIELVEILKDGDN